MTYENVPLAIFKNLGVVHLQCLYSSDHEILIVYQWSYCNTCILLLYCYITLVY